MKSIEQSITKELIVKKSKFICNIIPIKSEEEIKEILNSIKKEYKDATHNCYGYICGNLKKCSDDKEPSGTAGLPILNILEGYQLNMILAIITRYFGGIKLGVGGLTHAYSDSLKLALKEANIINLEIGKNITIEFSYDDIKLLDNILKNVDVLSKKYEKNVIYNFNITNTHFELLKDNINKYKFNIEKENILIKI